MASNRILTSLQVENLKRAANKRKRLTPGLTHSAALDQLANEHGFANWSLLAKVACATHVPTSKASIARKFQVRVSGWVMPEYRATQFWHVYLPTRYPAKHYETCKRVPEHWDVKRRSLESTLIAMEQLQMNVAFMDATELRPSKAFSSIFPNDGKDPALDHYCVWRTEDGKYVVSNEPYRGSQKCEGTKRWCEEHGWTYQELPKGIGMHNTCSIDCPDDCIAHTALILMSPPKNGANLQIIVERLVSHFHELNTTVMSPSVAINPE